MKKKKKINYVDNKKFYDAIVEYHRKKDETGIDKIPDYIGLCIYQIAINLANKPCFSNYSFKEEMIGDAIENCILYFDRFNAKEKSNPFAYFTTVIYYAFIRRIQKEERNRYAIYKSFYDVFGKEALTDEGFQPKSYENIETFIERFEAKEAARKKKKEAAAILGLEKIYEQDKELGKITSANTELDIVDA